MKNISVITILIVIFSSLGLVSCVEKEITVTSPDSNQKLIFSLTREGTPQYSLLSGKEVIITPSKMGFEFQETPSMSKGFEIISSETRSIDKSWEQPWGEFKTVHDKHEELVVHLQEKEAPERLMDIIFRVFNDGVGYRYSFPEQPSFKKVKISNELTEFNFPEEPEVWWAPVHRENSYYESFYRKSPMNQTDTINTPATFETKSGKYLAIHEANLTDFASMTLLNSKENQYKSELVPWANGVKVYAEAPFETPWRTIIVANDPGGLMTSTIMLNLNEPSVIDDESWIEPSKYIGIWWGMHLGKYTWGQGDKHGATTENTKNYIDFAAKNGFDGVLVEGWNKGWDGDWTADGTAFSFTNAYADFDLEEISEYAATKNVRLIGHHETAGAAKHYEDQMEEAFALYHRIGVNAVKTGYVNKYLDKKEWHDSQYGVRHYRKVIENAAKYHIMIDNHEPVKGTGLQRTYPNLMTQEGGRGQEYNAWSADGGNTPEHTTVVPFTRMLSGPFDFTPGIFDFDYETPNKARVQTTLAKQLALYVVLFSPLQMASDLPENYAGKPEFEFVKQVPSIWEDTKVLNAKIGDYTTVVRKDWDSEDWYLGSITDENPRVLSASLDFLEPGLKYKAVIYSDGKNADYKTDPYPVDIATQTVDNNSTLELNLQPGGGTAIKFTPLKD
ncbi:glycoside hydrolase family 97 protein [Salinimicrobium catena]|uniref:glycoside hydrolase family 97 protein n=1 Tax=Salinimicrobium catena TaxID=390640 RepID=UPI002FE4713D